jgi:hypothetical protein
MKKSVLGAIALSMTAAVATVNVGLNSQSNNLSGLSLANTEALAQEGNTNVITCYSTVRISLKDPNISEPVWAITFCNGCTASNCYEYKDSGTCTVNNGYHYVYKV